MKAYEILLLDILQSRSTENVMLKCADKNGEIQVCDIETALAGKFEFLSLADGRDINDVAAAVFALVVREN